ncbi:MAG: DUF4296 domain-containing protein [Ginsengibacter sp.]
MKPFLPIIICLFTLFSCSSKDKVPKSIIQPEKMGDVLWDIMRMQFLAEEMAVSDTGIHQEEKLNELTQKVFGIHEINTSKFEKSYNWYIRHPEILKRIFDSVEVQKRRIKEEADAVEDAPIPEPENRGLEKRILEREVEIE